jgi:hypothetical protein
LLKALLPPFLSHLFSQRVSPEVLDRHRQVFPHSPANNSAASVA